MRRRRIVAAAVAAPLVSASVTIAAVIATGAHRRTGLTRAEARARLSSDDLLPDATVQNDRAGVIEAPPGAVWPWLVQLGQDKSGFYSYEFLENLAGCKIDGADRIVPEWQHLRVGDCLRLHPEVALRIAHLDPATALAATSAGGRAPGTATLEMTWAFHLESVAHRTGQPPATRLHIRERYRTRDRRTRALVEVTSLLSAVMTRRMLSRLAGLAGAPEATPGNPRIDPPPMSG